MCWGREELVAVACDLCGGREVTPYYVRPDGLEVVLCAACGLAFASLWEMLLRRAIALGLV